MSRYFAIYVSSKKWSFISCLITDVKCFYWNQGCKFASNFKMRSDANAKISQKHFAKRCECEKISKSFCEAMRNFANFRKMRVFAKCEFSQNANFRKMRVFAKCVILKKVFMEIIFYYFFNLCTLMIKTHICAVSATGKKCS